MDSRTSATNQVAENLPPFFVTVLPHHFRSAILICEGIYMSMYPKYALVPKYLSPVLSNFVQIKKGPQFVKEFACDVQ